MSWRTRRTSSNAGWEPLELFFRDDLVTGDATQATGGEGGGTKP